MVCFFRELCLLGELSTETEKENDARDQELCSSWKENPREGNVAVLEDDREVMTRF